LVAVIVGLTIGTPAYARVTPPIVQVIPWITKHTAHAIRPTGRTVCDIWTRDAGSIYEVSCIRAGTAIIRCRTVIVKNAIPASIKLKLGGTGLAAIYSCTNAREGYPEDA
jgi:hypothetical protein